MSKRADAHIHLFDGGFQGSFTGRPGVQIDEVTCYESLMADHDIAASLVVGYAGDPWCRENNACITHLLKSHGWIHPTAYHDVTKPLTVDALRRLCDDGFVGISLYIFDDNHIAGLARIDDACWGWLCDHRWLISVNSKGEAWRGWQAVLDRHNDLRLVVAHLGLPDSSTSLEHVLALAKYPQVRVKLSGFYALTDPGHDYPHEAAWPHVEALLGAFGADRLLWGSDFTPSLDSLSFPQTFSLFDKMPFLTDADREMIAGRNLLALLDEVR